MKEYTIKYLKEQIEKKLSHNFGVSAKVASDELFYKASVLVLLDIMRERRSEFKKEAAAKEAKTVYYLSMEFLMGRSLKNSLYNLWKRLFKVLTLTLTSSTNTSPMQVLVTVVLAVLQPAS